MEVASRTEPAAAVRLATVPPSADITPTLADSLALRVTHGNVLDACTALLGAGPWLLMLDGCEHVLTSVRAVVSHLLDRCPDLTVLATSREPLAHAAEQRLRIGPLALTAPPAADQLDASPAVSLFLDRARRIDPGVPIGPGELDLVVDIVRRLEGMPLAIELAAGRLSSLGLADLHKRIDDALDVLDGGEVALRQTIAWSYELLQQDEQRLLRHLSAFPDGVDVDTAESVATDLQLPSAHHALSRLVDTSMLVRSAVESSVRYRQLDVVRTFASEALVSLGESVGTRTRHLDRFDDRHRPGITGRCDPSPRGPQPASDLDDASDRRPIRRRRTPCHGSERGRWLARLDRGVGVAAPTR
jgi:predicted ATPase